MKFKKYVLAASIILSALILCGSTFYYVISKNNQNEIIEKALQNKLEEKQKDIETLDISNQEVTTLTLNIKNLYGAIINYDGLSVDIAYRARIVPMTMYIDNDNREINSLTNVFKGETDIYPFNGNLQTPNYFQIKYTNVPKNFCNDLVYNIRGLFMSIEINNVQVYDWNNKRRIQVGDEKINEACNKDFNEFLLTRL